MSSTDREQELPPAPKTLDLRILAANLPPTWRKLRQLIEDLSAAHSSRSDLVLAADLAQRLLQIQLQRDQIPKEFAEDAGIAFFCAVVTLYARATKSRSKHRKTFDLRSMMDARERKAHKLICELRDDAIAHYGPGELAAGMAFREDKMFLLDGSQIVFATRNLAGSVSFAETLCEQSQRVLILMQRVHDQRETELIDYLNENGQALVQSGLWKRAVVELEASVGSEMAAQLMALPRAGNHRLSSDEN